MKPVYFAPLEGIGNHIYRGVFCRHYSGVDRFYTPFIDISSDGSMKNRNRNDILPENNKSLCLIPQILTKDAEALGEASRYIAGLGYGEINLNMGCPSATVTKKGKGAGMLADPDSLDRFLEKAFTVSRTKLSVKMRIGISDSSEWKKLLEVLNRYPLTELIVHPRFLAQAYEGCIHEDIFRQIYETAKAPVCLNPGIRTPEEYARYEAAYPGLTGLMIGRGLIANPALAEEIQQRGTFPLCTKRQTGNVPCIACGERSGESFGALCRFREFHDDLLDAYCEVLYGETPVLHKMKELWVFWESNIPLDAKLKKAIAKASSVSEYRTLTRRIL